MGKIIGKSIGNIISLVIGIAGTVITLFFPDLLNGPSVQNKVLLAIIIILVIALAQCVVIIRKLNTNAPKDEKISVRNYNATVDQFIITTNLPIKIGCVLGVYYEDGEYEQEIGLGKVVADTGKAYQMEMMGISRAFVKQYKDDFEKILKGEPNHLKRMVVKYWVNETLLRLEAENERSESC